MKTANSRFIEIFLAAVRGGAITVREDLRGQEILNRMVNAMQSILAGESPDTALEIKRTAGGSTDPVILALAWLMHTWRQSGDKWVVIELKAAEWLASQDRKCPSLPRLKKILKDNDLVIQQKKSVIQMIELVNTDIQK